MLDLYVHRVAYRSVYLVVLAFLDDTSDKVVKSKIVVTFNKEEDEMFYCEKMLKTLFGKIKRTYTSNFDVEGFVNSNILLEYTDFNIAKKYMEHILTRRDVIDKLDRILTLHSLAIGYQRNKGLLDSLELEGSAVNYTNNNLVCSQNLLIGINNQIMILTHDLSVYCSRDTYIIGKSPSTMFKSSEDIIRISCEGLIYHQYYQKFKEFTEGNVYEVPSARGVSEPEVKIETPITSTIVNTDTILEVDDTYKEKQAETCSTMNEDDLEIFIDRLEHHRIKDDTEESIDVSFGQGNGTIGLCKINKDLKEEDILPTFKEKLGVKNFLSEMVDTVASVSEEKSYGTKKTLLGFCKKCKSTRERGNNTRRLIKKLFFLSERLKESDSSLLRPLAGFNLNDTCNELAQLYFAFQSLPAKYLRLDMKSANPYAGMKMSDVEQLILETINFMLKQLLELVDNLDTSFEVESILYMRTKALISRFIGVNRSLGAVYFIYRLDDDEDE